MSTYEVNITCGITSTGCRVRTHVNLAEQSGLRSLHHSALPFLTEGQIEPRDYSLIHTNHQAMSAHPQQLAIVTGEMAPKLSDGGKQLAAELAEHGIDSDPVMWNDSSVDWAAFDAVLFRSCWDYPDDRERFQAMLRELETAPVQVCNPLDVIQWNLHKSYLTTLADAGITIPDTTVVDQGADVSLETLFETQNREELLY
jgi:hypothetical protein